ncbi:transmembrane protein 260-like isoform X3 [Pomacea canaliculata]|uniref:transmembrane protein 260-like isoform X3 n=1 Tax=Pomacea canaliculata TaxID=400727 RepID=UPI000D73DDED|nr:transmembrane protein 260-like isoform X3 [Pomacea canaliculata]
MWGTRRRPVLQGERWRKRSVGANAMPQENSTPQKLSVANVSRKENKENNIPNSDEFRKLYLDPRNISLRGKQCAEMQGQRREKLEKRNSMWNDNQAATSRFMAGGWTGTTLVFAILAAVYIKTMHPSLPGGDSGELILAAHELGVAHPPGYPLYTMLLKLILLVCPCGSVAWKANLFSAVCAAAAGGLLFRTVYLMTGCLAPGLLAAGMFGFSRLTWSWSVRAEVFALNNLLLGMLLLVAVQFNFSSLKDRVKISKVGALICGLCLTNQHTSVIYVAVLALWVLFILHREQMLSLNILVQVTMYFIAGLLPYLYLPLSALSKKARSTWGDQSSFTGFFVHLLRREYGTLDLLKDHEGQGFFWGIWAYIKHVSTDLTPAVCSLL